MEGNRKEGREKNERNTWGGGVSTSTGAVKRRT